MKLKTQRKTKSEGSHDEEHQLITVAMGCTIKCCLVMVQADGKAKVLVG